MDKLVASIRRFLSELRRRNVYQVGATYLVAGFVALQLAQLAAGAFGLPDWFEPMVWTLVGAGLPIALVIAWAFELTPEGVRPTPDAGRPDDTSDQEEAQEDKGRPPAATVQEVWVGGSVLVLLLLGTWWLVGGLPGDGGAQGDSPNDTGSPSEPRGRTVAVLPFEVSGAGADAWRDGMVTMLSTGLDGAAGLRAIADRTVFAAWQRQDSTRAGASTEEALSVARSLGAEYAILGSAVQLGGELRLVAEVRRTGSGNRLGQVDVRGVPDSVTALANRLTRKSLGVLLNRSEEQIPSVNLQSITTSSLEALKAFLQGERHFRAGEYEPAIKDYEAATQNDSTFALAYARLAVSRGWRGGRGSADGALRRAYQLSERLSRREQRLIRARYLRKVKDRPSEAADSLRQLTEDYPEDPSVWYFLGEALYHGNLPGGLRASEAAFQEAVRLDSGVAPYHHHLVELAFKVHHDSALAARRIEAHPDGARKRWYQTAWDLVFGPPERREDAWARVDTLAIGNLAPLQNPLDWKLHGRALRILAKREATGSQFQISQATYELWGGRVDSALQRLPDQAWTNVRLALAQTLGYPIPDSLLRARLAPQGLGPDATPPELAATGLYLIEQGREEELGPILERLDSVATRDVKGYRAFRAGNLEEAAKHWEAVESRTPVSAIWRGDLYRKVGTLSTARDWYRAAWDLPVAHERLGQLYEDMDQPEKAQAAYQRFVAAWEGADPELQPRVETARERIDALTSKSAAE